MSGPWSGWHWNSSAEAASRLYSLEELVGDTVEPIHIAIVGAPRALCGARTGRDLGPHRGPVSAPLCGRCKKLADDHMRGAL